MAKKATFLLSLLVVVGLVLTACGPKPTEAPAAPTEVATEAPVEVGLAVSGEITLWHSYHTGETEEQALTQLAEQARTAYPDATINVLQVPFDQIFNKWETEIAAGGGPDMLIAPNDSLGKEVRANLLLSLDDLLAGQLDNLSQVSIDGMTVDGHLYAVPESLKAVALFYNKEAVPTPPATTDELLQMVQEGKRFGVMQHPYHNFGFFGAFGGTLMDADGKCIADQAGFTEAMQYLADLKAAGGIFETDEGKLNTMFQTGEVDMMISGPWMLGVFKNSLGDKLGVAPMPAGPAGPAAPLTGVDGWYINVNSENPESAVALALFLTNKESMQVMVDMAGHVPARTDIEVTDSLVKGFADACATGTPRPQNAEFDNFWTPFSDMVTKVLEGLVTPEEGVAEACQTMNTASGK